MKQKFQIVNNIQIKMKKDIENVNIHIKIKKRKKIKKFS